MQRLKPQLKYRFSGICRCEGGFTLVEVLATIIIMGIVFAIASSTWFSVVESRQVDSAANQVAADLRLANNSASNRLTEYQVAYKPSGKVADCLNADYCLLKRTASGTYEKTPRYLPERTEISDTTLNSVDSSLAALLGLESDVRSIRFRANGSAEATNGLISGATVPRITVSSADGAPSRDIEVIPATSRVELD